MCNKISYETKKKAKDHYSYLRRNGRLTQIKKMRPYLCYSCNKWHLTSMAKSYEKRLKRNIKNTIEYVGLIKEFKGLTSNDDRWEFIIKHQSSWIEVNIEEHRAWVVFGGRVRVLFD